MASQRKDRTEKIILVKLLVGRKMLRPFAQQQLVL
jgi:hypothetical protein